MSCCFFCPPYLQSAFWVSNFPSTSSSFCLLGISIFYFSCYVKVSIYFYLVQNCHQKNDDHGSPLFFIFKTLNKFSILDISYPFISYPFTQAQCRLSIFFSLHFLPAIYPVGIKFFKNSFLILFSRKFNYVWYFVNVSLCFRFIYNNIVVQMFHPWYFQPPSVAHFYYQGKMYKSF